MQKKLMALAVAGALAVPAVAAAQSTVTISGRATIEYGRADQGSTRPSTDLMDNPGGSNIRFRGTENLGGGMSAWFQCESSTDVRGIDGPGGSGFCTRNSAVGFRGGFGNVFIGKWDTPFKRAMNQGSTGAEETGILGMSFIGFGGSGGADTGGEADSVNRQRWKRRESSILQYETPKFGGFQVLAAMNDGAAATLAVNGQSNDKPRLWSVGATFDRGPLEVGLAYEKHLDMGGLGNAAGDLDDRAWGFGISYTFGPVQVGFTWLDTKYETGVGQETKKKTWTLGADWRLPGPHMLSAQYARARDTQGNGGNIGGNGGVTGCGAVPNCSDTGADAWSLGYTYRFSKRTSARLGYIRVDNDARTNSNRIGSNGSLANGDNVDGWALLVKHDF